jgi:hypothetical protein
VNNQATWLTRETAVPEARELIKAIDEDIENHQFQRSFSESEEDIYHAQRQRVAANAAMLQGRFYASLGVLDVPDEHAKVTFYLSRAFNAYYFSTFNVVPWTNWVGNLYTQLRNALQDGCLPDKAEYGPMGLRCLRPLGPLVEYGFRDGTLTRVDFYSGDDIFPLLGVPSVVGEKVPSFGLKEIIQTIDLDQNDRIRGPMHGAYILTGGPGVGKTTVALHRIPYLINEQGSYADRRAGATAYQQDQFFSQDATLVVVWKEHLVPYLRKCLFDLSMLEFPTENVKHVGSWIERQIWHYVPIGSGRDRFKIGEEPPSVADAKLKLCEADIQNFIRSPHPIAQESAAAINGVAADIRQSLAQASASARFKYSFTFIVAVNDYEFTVAGIEKVIADMRARVPETPSERDPDHRKVASVLSRARDQINQLRNRELDRLAKYVPLLYQFYQSTIVSHRIAAQQGKAFAGELHEAITRQAENRTISTADTYLLLWLIHFLTNDSSATAPKLMPLPRYSHILIDEAQYYHPLVLRLFAALARLDEMPQGTMTIVGDLEQLVSLKGGLVRWEDVGLAIPPENINKLRINYRSSRQVFEFLKVYRDVAGIAEELIKPRLWYSGEGTRPEIRACADREAEIVCVAERISELRTASETEKWTIAIVLPESLIPSISNQLITELKTYAVSARVASGEDVKESVEKVIVTDYDSIVGLEFDAVFLFGCDEALKEGRKEEVQAVWVALSRPRLFQHITHVGPARVFGDPAFSAFRSDDGSSAGQ